MIARGLEVTLNSEQQRDLEHAAQTGRTLDIPGLLGILKRQWVILLCFTLVVPAAALAYSLHATKMYKATSAILFQQSQAQPQGSSTSQPLTEFDTQPARVVATNIALVTLPAVIDATARIMHMRPALVKSEVSVGAGAGDTDVATISVTDPDPKRAAALANTYAFQYIKFRRGADVQKIYQSQQLILAAIQSLGPGGARSAGAKQLASEANALKISAALQTGGAELVQTAVAPSSPFSPDTPSNVLFGLIVGIALGLAAALLRHRFDRRLHSPEQAADLFGRPLLAAIPYARHLGGETPAYVSEAFMMLRANLRYFNFWVRGAWSW